MLCLSIPSKTSRGLNIYPVDTSNNYFAFRYPVKPLEQTYKIIEF